MKNGEKNVKWDEKGKKMAKNKIFNIIIHKLKFYKKMVKIKI